jgi:hypothetical protein
MNLINPTVAKSLKVASILVMTGSLGLSSWNLSLHLHGKSTPPNLNSLFWLASIVLIAHGIEGLIAASKARSRHKNPLLYGIYTFFVGFAGLQELANKSD